MKGDTILTEYGRIGKAFSKANLSDLCVGKGGVQTGPFGSQLHKEDYVDVGTPIITVEHLGDNRINHIDAPMVSEEDKKRLVKYSLTEGDIVFSRVGSVDRRALVRAEESGWLFSGRCLRVRVDKSIIDPKYLSHFFGFEGFKEHIRSIAVGATMPSINTKILSEIPIYFPPLAEQKRIAHILGSLDDKIEVNRKMNETLEAMAQALFKSWFVDFDPVFDNALAAGNEIPEELREKAERRRAVLAGNGEAKESATHSSELNALFPSEFELSDEMGWVPKGWEVKLIEDLFELHRGFDLPTAKRIEGPYPIYSSGGIHGSHDEFKIEPPGVITGRSGVLGNVFLSLEKYWPLNTSLYIREFRAAGAYYSYFLLKTFDFSSLNSGSAVPSLNRNTVHSTSSVIPDKSVLDKFEDFSRGQFTKMAKNQKQQESLTQLRDTLLPKLLSGEQL
ncbi:MAG: restriction endonuclease subunit S [Lentisphaeraceae bacterium]|nr:restriction endonuclease subunit S [Lentisphaeraceae bacterium]